LKINHRLLRRQAVRGWPVFVPIILVGGLAGWKSLVIAPSWRNERAAEMPVRRLISETDALRHSFSDYTAAQTSADFRAAERQVWPDAKAATDAVRTLVQGATEQGWAVKVNWSPAGPAAGSGLLGAMEAKLVLTSPAGARRPWQGLEAWLASGLKEWPQIGFSRLAVRADVKGRYSVEATLRLAYLFSHAEIPQ
jgi:hypothetical protein